MNAQTPHSDPMTQAAIQNGAVLRAIAGAETPLHTPGEVAHAAGVPTKNNARTMLALTTDGLVDQGGEGGGYRLTEAGRRALLALDVWEGRVEAGQGASAPAANDVLVLAHHQMRANPLQPRKHFDREALDQLKAGIVAAKDVLHTLVVFPADEDGVHVLSDGERRWRAVGELIEEGMWPAGRGLRVIVRENTPGQAAFIGLVTNNPTAKLSMIEQARAYETLVADTGWSARNAALQTSRDPRTVQEMLKVLREADPAHIAAHEAGDPDWKWEALRDSVKEGRAEGEEPAQLDVETAAVEADDPLMVNGVRFPNAVRAAEARRLLEGGGPSNTGTGATRPAPAVGVTLTKVDLLALVELAHRLNHHGGAPEPGQRRWTEARKYWLDISASNLKAAGLVEFSGAFPNGPHARLTVDGNDKLRDHQVDSGVVLDSDLEIARTRAGYPAAMGALYVTPWLNVEAAGEAAPPAVFTPPAAASNDPDEFDQAHAVLGEVATALDSSDDFDPAALFARAGVKFPLRLSRGLEIEDAAGEPILELCGHGDIIDDLLRARALLLVSSLNELVAPFLFDRDAQRMTPARPIRKTEDGPAIPIRKSITPSAFACVEDGARTTHVGRHVLLGYSLSAADFRERWSLPADYPMVAPNAMKDRSDLMRSIGVDPWDWHVDEEEDAA